MNFDVESILDRLGYPIAVRGKNCICPTDYRGGDTPTGLYVNETGFCHDLITGEDFHITRLVQAILGGSLAQAEAFVGSNQTIAAKKAEIIDMPPEFDARDIQNLTPSFKFYHNKGIKTETLETFKAGFCHGGKYNLRIVFPIFDNDKIIGVAARDAANRDYAPKWKLSKKENFVYPLFVSRPYILEKRSVVLVESVGDMLNLWQNGVRNVLVVFGISLSKKMERTLISLNPSKIYLALNKDQNERGQQATVKLKDKLSSGLTLIVSLTLRRMKTISE